MSTNEAELYGRLEAALKQQIKVTFVPYNFKSVMFRLNTAARPCSYC